MLSNMFVSNYMFVDDDGLEVKLSKINVVLGMTSIKASYFVAPLLLNGVMSNLNVRYASQKFSFGSFEEIVYNGTMSKPVTIYLRFRNFRRPLHESFFSVLFSAFPLGFDRYAEEFKNIETLDLFVEILGERVINLRMTINEHIMFTISRREVWTWKIEADHQAIIEKTNAFPAINFNGLINSINSSIKYVDIRSWLMDKYQTLGTETPRAVIAKMLIDLFSDLDNAKRIGEFLRNSGNFTVRLRYIPPSSLGIEYKIAKSWKKMNFYDLDFITLLPTLAMILGSQRGDTIVILEPAILSPRLQRALFDLAVDVALKEDKQIVFLTNSPVIVEELLDRSDELKGIASLKAMYYGDSAKILDIPFDKSGLRVSPENKRIFEEFWTDKIIQRLLYQ